MFLIWQCITISHRILLIWFGWSKRAYWQCVCVCVCVPDSLIVLKQQGHVVLLSGTHRIHKNKHVCPHMLWPTKLNIMCRATSAVDSKHFSRTFILLLDTPLRRAQWKWSVWWWWYYSTLWPWTILAWPVLLCNLCHYQQVEAWPLLGRSVLELIISTTVLYLVQAHTKL